MEQSSHFPVSKLTPKDVLREGLKDHITQRLKNETLIDIKNKKGSKPPPLSPDELRFCASYVQSNLFSEAEVIAFIEQAERLLKRSDNNIETLLQLLEELS
jgi:hypothetical protein